MVKRRRLFEADIGIACVIVGLFMAWAGTASANQISNRSAQVSSSVAGATATWLFTFSPPTSTPIQSVRFQVCTTAAGTCSVPTGFAHASTTLTATSGLGTGFVVDNSSFSDSLAVKSTTNTTAPSASSSVTFGVVTNPTVSGSFFIHITTYSDAAYTTSIDSGTTVQAIVTPVSVTATVMETLTFSVGSTVTAPGTNCTPFSDSGALTIGLNGVLDPTTAYSAHSYFRVSTNAGTGVVIRYAGATLASGSNQITAIGATSTTSVPGSSQFGLALDTSDTEGGSGYSFTSLHRAVNYTSGSGTINGGSPTAQFAFDPTSATTPVTIASSTASVLCDTGSVRYLANISPTTPSGIYTTAIIYIATSTY